MNKKYTLNTILPVVLGAYLLVTVIVRTFWPRMILPVLDIPMLTAISLAVLLLDHYLAPGAERCYICIPVFAVITFGLLGFAALLSLMTAVELAVKGAAVFTVATWLFTSMVDRLSTGPAVKAAPFISASAARNLPWTACLTGTESSLAIIRESGRRVWAVR